MKLKHVVTSFLEFKGRILLLRRSGKVGTYRGRWAGVSGYIEGCENPYSRAVKEVEEEVGLDRNQIELVKAGSPITIVDREIETLWIVHPFLFKAETDKIKIDWETLEARWVNPSELRMYETVPMLPETLNRVKEYSGKIDRRIIRKIEKIKRDRRSGASQLAREAALTMKLAAEKCEAATVSDYIHCLDTVGCKLKKARPSMASLTSMVGLILRFALEKSENVKLTDLRRQVQLKTDELICSSEKASFGAAAEASKLIRDNAAVLTHSYSSTVINAFKAILQSGKKVEAIVTESRPLMEGRRTAALLAEMGVPVTFIVDFAAGGFIDKVDLVLVGADSILSDGSIVNKIGTSLLASAAYEQKIPFYSVCETLKFNLKDFLGEKIELETGEPLEVLRSADKITVKNIYFDVTAARYVTGIVTEKGLIKTADVSLFMEKILENVFI